jgi:hypothetical protein
MANIVKQIRRSSGAFVATLILLLLAACNSQKGGAAPAAPPATSTTTSRGDSSQMPPQQTPPDPQPLSATAVATAQTSPCDSATNPKRCFFSDPFTVSIINVDHTLAAYHVIRLNIEFRNLGKVPVMLAYQANTGKAVDNLGNGYAVKTVPTGVPTDYGTRTDPRLTLQPGEAHMGTFEAVGYRTEKDPATFNYDFTIDELGADKPAPVLREHAVYFRDVSPAMPGGK